MSDYTPTISELREAWLSTEFEEHDSTTSDDDLRAEFDRALAAHDSEIARAAVLMLIAEQVNGREVRPGVVAEEPEWEYGVGWRWNDRVVAFSTITRTAAEDYIERHPEDLDFGSHILVQREPERPAGPWVPVKQEGESDE